MNRWPLLTLLLLSSPTLAADPPLASEQATSFDHSHTAFSAVLEARLADGRVDYSGIKASPQQLNAYLKGLESVSSMDGWSRDQQLAFWINAYNAYTLQLIVQNMPVESIRDIGWPWSPWKKSFITLAAHNSRPLSLDDIEHTIIRGTFKEPRIHFALVCASTSCPPLRAEAYTAARLDAQLTDQGNVFLHDSSKNRVNSEAGTLELSRIFEWYGADFNTDSHTLSNTLATYFTGEVADAIRAERLKLTYLPYDWSLNGS